MSHLESNGVQGSRIRVLAVGFAAILLASCATMKPGTGDVAFRLRWEGTADLDLHVRDPDDGYVSFLTVHAPMLSEDEPHCEGILDIDCNSAPDRLCKKPIENIFWPVGRAPEGTYTVWTHLFQALRDGSEVPFTIEILRGESVVEELGGKLSDEHRTSQRFTYVYRREGP